MLWVVVDVGDCGVRRETGVSVDFKFAVHDSNTTDHTLTGTHHPINMTALGSPDPLLSISTSCPRIDTAIQSMRVPPCLRTCRVLSALVNFAYRS